MEEFEWDPEKALANRAKHGVAFEEAATVFSDWGELTYPDGWHSTSEDRFITIAVSDSGRLLAVSHTDRGEKIRIISARMATPGEMRAYEEKNRSG